MKPFRWGADKDEALKSERRISFESVVVAIESGGLLDVLAHPNPGKYPQQRILVVAADNCVYLVPFVDEKDCYFLKTIIPSRKAIRDFLKQDESDEKD